MKTPLIVLVLICFCGCSPQKGFAQRLKSADRLVVTNTTDGVGFTMTGNEMEKIVTALAVGKRADGLTAAVSFELQFFKGGQRLETVVASEVGAFGIRGGIYRDDTGTMKALSERFGATNGPKSLP